LTPCVGDGGQRGVCCHEVSVRSGFLSDRQHDPEIANVVIPPTAKAGPEAEGGAGVHQRGELASPPSGYRREAIIAQER
jgi:hypothetical protein